MPIDPKQALGHELKPTEHAWSVDDVILYHLGVGAGEPDPTDENELEYAYERNLKVLPSFGVIPVFTLCAGLVRAPGLKFNPMMLLHGEQDLTLHAALPTSASVRNTGRVAEIWDKGKGAVVTVEAETETRDGDKLCTNRFTAFIRGEGGFGGEAGPSPGNEPPDRAPDHVVESPTRPSQALLYRLSGDKNPLHADPDFAKLGGFDKPILHGLCSYGVVCKAAIDAALGGDVTRVARYQARFAGVVFPGETIETSLWSQGDRILIAARAKERDSAVITNAAITPR